MLCLHATASGEPIACAYKPKSQRGSPPPATSSPGSWPFGEAEPTGLPLSLDTCTNRAIDNMVIAKVAVMCETIVTFPKEAWHCGLLAETADGEYTRRYDLGPRNFQVSINPADILKIGIHCTEKDPDRNQLHGEPQPDWLLGDAWKSKRVPQFAWEDTPLVAAKRKLKFKDLEYIIKTYRFGPTLYDLSGGNCQHFSFLLYELMTKEDCHSIQTPNHDTWGELVRFLGQGAMDSLKGTLKAISDGFQGAAGYTPPAAKFCSAEEPWASIAQGDY